MNKIFVLFNELYTRADKYKAAKLHSPVLNFAYPSIKSFLSCFMPCGESEAWCTTFHIKTSFHSHANKTHFHMKSSSRGIKQLGNGLSNSYSLTVRWVLAVKRVALLNRFKPT